LGALPALGQHCGGVLHPHGFVSMVCGVSKLSPLYYSTLEVEGEGN
jgi:hypothetical protein